MRWPEGFVCRRCFQRATRQHGSCPACGTERLLPGLRDGDPVCAPCAGIDYDFTCARCGAEDEHRRDHQCARCVLRDDLTTLLDDGTGHPRAELVPLIDALCSQDRPRNAFIWLRNAEVTRILRALADGTTALTHASLDAEPVRATANHLDALLTQLHILPERDTTIAMFERWLATRLPAYPPEHAQLLERFATWHHLRRMRQRADTGTLKPGAANSAKQEISVAAQFLAHLADHGATLLETTQRHIDTWLAPGPSTRYVARGFAHWAIRNHLMPALDFPRRLAKTVPVLTQEERLTLLGGALHDTTMSTTVRLAAVLLLLYAQPIARITQLTTGDVDLEADPPTITFGDDPAILPGPVAALARDHLVDRPNTHTTTGKNSPWLFVGYRPARPLDPNYLMGKLRGAGIDLRGARNAALRQLVLDMPPAIAADTLGYAYTTTERHARTAGTTWGAYPSTR